MNNNRESDSLQKVESSNQGLELSGGAGVGNNAGVGGNGSPVFLVSSNKNEDDHDVNREIKVESSLGKVGDENMEDGSDKGKSSISVLFADFIPEGTSTNNPSPEIKPLFGGNRPRYFNHTNTGSGRFRPGLGLNIDLSEFAKAKHKKKKKPKPKASFGIGEAFAAKRLKLSPEKPPCAALHELYPHLEYHYNEFKTDGSPTPSFTCTVVFSEEGNDKNEFVGEGRSKKTAKNDVAEKLLTHLGYIYSAPPEPQEETRPRSVTPVSAQMHESRLIESPPFQNMNFQESRPAPMELDFASDDIINVNFAGLPQTQHPSMLSQPMIPTQTLRRLRNIPNFEENVTLALNTLLFPEGVEFESIGEVGPPHERIFTMKVTFGSRRQEFLGTGGSKKKAKADAAKKAVISLLGESCYQSMVNHSPVLPPQQQSTSFPGGKKKRTHSQMQDIDFQMDTPPGAEQDQDEDDGDDWGEYDLNFSDHVSNVVREKYEELMAQDPNYYPFKVLAGVVMTTDSPLIFNSTVIAVTTGTKCIEGDFLSEQGLSVNDCHAEILATRCVRDFLYSQIEILENSGSKKEKDECILEVNTSPLGPFKYKLKENVKFHLYINTSPCGDARIFSPKGIELEEDQQPSPSPTGPTDLEDNHPNKLNRGVLRSKIEAGEGTIPAANLYKGPQTWDSIVGGSALYTMSCSDKVCRWNVLGLQGALLYNFLGSVYYSSITLGSLHHPVHFKRAVYGRVEALNSRLEMPFHINKPKLMMVSREEKRKVKKSPNHAVCWTSNWSTPEVLAANKGRCEPGGVASRLTKRTALSHFLKLYNNVGGKRENYADLTYHEAKQLAAGYQKAKEEFIMYFKDSKLGPWIGKPVEQDSFKISK